MPLSSETVCTVPSDPGPSLPAVPGQGQTVVASAPGTLGELMQGERWGRPFLVTLPVDRWSRATARWVAASRPRVLDACGVAGRLPKTQAAVERLLASRAAVLPRWRSVEVQVTSEIAVGKGMASSSADIVAALRATSELLGQSVDEAWIAALAAAVEPTDGVMYRGCVAFDFMAGEHLETLGDLPPATLVVVDPGGRVETTAMRRLPYRRDEKAQLDEAYRMLLHGFARQDLALIGQAATVSAIVNQRRLPKPEVDWLVPRLNDFEALGVITAHSGVLTALLLPSTTDELVDEVRRRLRAQWPDVDVEVVLPAFSSRLVTEGAAA